MRTYRPLRRDGIFLVTLIFLTACSIRVVPADETVAPPTPSPAAATPTPNLPPEPSATPLPPSLTPTVIVTPVEGTITTQINVRAGPGTEYAAIGVLEHYQKVQIVGKDQSGAWYVILYASGQNGRGWVAAKYIQTGNTQNLPVVAMVVVAGTPGALTGKVLQKVNVRSGPGTNYDSLGMLAPLTTVTLTGKNETGTWLQIEYAAAPNGKGWITAEYVQVSNTSGLPVLADSGTPLAGHGTPATIPATPTATIVPALADGDSPAAPAARVTLSPNMLRLFSYSSDVSAPAGDAADWVEFTAAAPVGSVVTVYASLICSGNGALAVELWQNGAPLAGWGTLACGDSKRQITLSSGQTYQFFLQAGGTGDSLRYIYYTLTIQIIP